MVFEIIQVPGYGLVIETLTRITDPVIQVSPRLHLKPRQYPGDLAVGVNDFQIDILTLTVFRKQLV